MREILYFQAGRYANYLGTHFWNTQESYFTYGEDAEEPLVDHDISFREGVSQNGEPTYCPRLILFDRKSNFGSLSDLYGSGAREDSEDITSEWDGDVVEYRSDAVPRSDYHTRLETADEHQAKTSRRDEDIHTGTHIDDSKIRYWADYSRVFLHPRTVQRLSDPPEWDAAQGDWVKSREEFERLDEEHNIMENSVRTFVEECDNLQGVQLLNETSTFGSFTCSFLSQFRDEFNKISTFAVPLLSNAVPGNIDIDDSSSMMNVLNDALCLRSLNELATVVIPIQNPSTWNPSSWHQRLNINLSEEYHTSAILATHVESVTLPMRLKNPARTMDMSDLSSLLNWRANTKFVNLQGAFPLYSRKGWNFEPDITSQVYDFSARSNASQVNAFARADTLRGLSSISVSYDDWAQRFQPAFATHAPANPLPTSYPRIFDSHESRAHGVSGFSSLVTSPNAGAMFSTYASFVDVCIRRHSDVVARLSLEMDELKDLRDDLWVLEDAYRVEEESGPMDEDD